MGIHSHPVVLATYRLCETLPGPELLHCGRFFILSGIFHSYHILDIIVSDNAAQFTSAEFKDFIDGNLIHHVMSAPFHPATNSPAEHIVKMTREVLSLFMQGTWDQRLTVLLLGQRVTTCITSGRSPAELLVGQRLITRLD